MPVLGKTKKGRLNNPEAEADDDGLEKEFSLFAELLKARMEAGLTQAEVARRMGTQTPAIARLEAGGGNKRHSPSISTLRRYARAVGCQLEIRLVQTLVKSKAKEANPQ